MERGCQTQKNNFQPWQGKFIGLRKKDMLLKYLKQSRDADNHSIQEIAEYSPGGWRAKHENPQKNIYRKNGNKRGKIEEYQGDPITITAFPATVVGIRFKNSGDWYNPPTVHLSNSIPNNTIVFSELGIKFYED